VTLSPEATASVKRSLILFVVEKFHVILKSLVRIGVPMGWTTCTNSECIESAYMLENPGELASASCLGPKGKFSAHMLALRTANSCDAIGPDAALVIVVLTGTVELVVEVPADP
jgi:hypothetical protein